ncbi:hypothetical protein D3C78_1620640 [compost metagenome]
MRLDVTQHDDAADRGDVQVAILEGHADRHVQVIGDHPDLAAFRLQRVDLAAVPAAHEQRALGAPGHGAGVGQLVAENLDAKALRKPDVIQRRGAGRGGESGQQREGGQGMAMHARKLLGGCALQSSPLP